MKKVLFATTALVATAGLAAAETSISGYAEIGIVSGDRYGAGSDAQFHNDIDVKFSLSGETDSGLTFGATIDLDELNGDSIDAQGGGSASILHLENDSSVFVSGSFGKVTMGDTDGAFDWAMQEVGIGSSIADDHTTHSGFNFNSGLDGLSALGPIFSGIYDGQVLRYDNTFGDFGVAVSAELFDAPGGLDPVWGVGVKYNLGLGGADLGLGLGYQTVDVGAGPTADLWGVSVDAKLGGGLRAIVSYSTLDWLGAGDIEHIGVGLGYSMDALTVSANWGEYDDPIYGDRDSVGVAANLDLGGGAAVQFGYGADVGAIGAESWSLGMALSF